MCLFVHVYMQVCVHVSADARGVQKRVLDLDLESQAVVSCPV